MHVNLADVASADVAVGLTLKAVRGAGVIRLLSGNRGCGYYVISGRAYTCHGQQQNCSTEPFSTHLSSGAEGPRSCSSRFSREARPPADSPEPAFFLGQTFWDFLKRDFLERLSGIACSLLRE